LGTFCERNGTEILKRPVHLRSGHQITMLLCAENALDWLLKQLNSSESGLVEYLRRNPHGIENQVWKDSKEFYVHTNGQLANHSRPIASIEVQGIAYDALMAAAKLLPNKAEQLTQRAHQLRDRTISLLWQLPQEYFALGSDYDDFGSLRIIETLTANPAALLDTGIFDDLEDTERQRYITAIIRKIMSPEFLTDAGIRSRALSEAKLIPFWDYHGSFVSWPKETYDIAKGLKRQGFPYLAMQLENRLINLVRRSRSYPEFVYVDQYGRVLADAPARHDHGDVVLVDSTNKPEQIQAWTVSALLAISLSRPRKVRLKVQQQPWQQELERRLLISIPEVKPMLSSQTLKARYPSYPYKLAPKEGA
jgi:glycogen debranching enzyme